MLSCRVDALTIAYRGKLAVRIHERVAMSLELAKQRRVQVPVEVDGITFALQPDGAKAFAVRLTNSDLTVLIGQGIKGFKVQIKASATYLATTPLEQVLTTFERIAKTWLGGTIEEARVWRLDLCADATNLNFSPADSKRFVGRARKRVQCEVRELSEGGIQRFTGFLIARGNPLSMRLYDKTEELRSQHLPDSVKTRIEHDTWLAAGWDGRSQVWRLEFELKSKALDSLGARDPLTLLCGLDSLWSYLVGQPTGKEGWLRLTLPGSARRERRNIDERWEVFRSAIFKFRAAPCARSSGNSKGSPILQTMGNVLSTLGSWGALAGDSASLEETLHADFELLKSAIHADAGLLQRYGELRSGKIAAGHNVSHAPSGS